MVAKAKKKKKQSTASMAMSALGSAGGNALVKKRGRSYMVALANKGWKKRKAAASA